MSRLEEAAIADLSSARKAKQQSQPLAALWDELGLTLTTAGQPHANTANATRILRLHPEFKGLIWLDTFRGEVIGPDGVWSDIDTVKAANFMQEQVGVPKMPPQVVSTAIPVVASDNARSSARDFIDSLSWDGQPRLDALFSTGFGAADSAYTRAVGSCFLIGAVARIYKPGVKVDTVPVLEGPQGSRKSSGLRALVGDDWFAEASESPHSKDFFLGMQGKLVLEFAELDAISRADVTAVKRVITSPSDRYRAPYASRAIDHPRQCVFAGTTNRDDWNRDDTGARRFWPVRCGQVNVEWLTACREQLFAEAAHRYRHGESWWEVPEADAVREQQARAEGDPWDEVIERWLSGKSYTTVAAVLEYGIGVEPAHFTKAAQMRVGAVLRRQGWERVKRRVEGTPVWGWERKCSHPAEFVPANATEEGTPQAALQADVPTVPTVPTSP